MPWLSRIKIAENNARVEQREREHAAVQAHTRELLDTSRQAHREMQVALTETQSKYEDAEKRIEGLLAALADSVDRCALAESRLAEMNERVWLRGEVSRLTDELLGFVRAGFQLPEPNALEQPSGVELPPVIWTAIGKRSFDTATRQATEDYAAKQLALRGAEAVDDIAHEILTGTTL